MKSETYPRNRGFIKSIDENISFRSNGDKAFSLERDENNLPTFLDTVHSALELTSQDWDSVGLHGVSSSAVSTKDINGVRDRVFSILILRVIAIVCQKTQEQRTEKSTVKTNTGKVSQFVFADFSTTTICQTIIALHENGPSEPVWPEEITPEVIQNVLDYTLFILKTYRKVPYHNAGHAYHVMSSSNKLLDILLCDHELITDFHPYKENDASAGSESEVKKKKIHKKNVYISSGNTCVAQFKRRSDVSSSFGIKKDTLIHFAFLFSALVHDVDHTGVSNGQLVLESDELAILYNDQSVLEQRSLAVAFRELRKSAYQPLRDVLYAGAEEEYARFRRTVIDLVLCTDIGSPERVQIVKSKWKEAFGDTHEAKKRKAKKEMRLLQKSFQDLGVDSNLLSQSMPHVSQTIANVQYNLRHERSKDYYESDSASPHDSSLTGMFLRERTSMQFSSVAGNGLDNSTSNSFKCSDSQTSYFTSSSESDFDSDSDIEERLNDLLPDEIDSKDLKNEGQEVKTVSITKRSSLTGQSVKFDLKAKDQRRGSEMSIRSNLSSKSNRSNRSNRSNKSKGSSKSSRRHSGRSDPGTLETGRQRRFTAPAVIKKKNYRPYRLGIRRALDLTGRTIDFHLNQNEAIASVYSPNSSDDDECDDMKKIVVLEQMLMAADVSANMQGWENMLKWNTRLFNEQKGSFEDGRGVDPVCGWYDGQITFFNCYTLLLARRLAETGVFGDDGEHFANNVERNRDQWIEKGVAATSQMIYEWDQKQKRRTSRNS